MIGEALQYLLVVFILMNGEWVRGDDIEGWSSMPFPTQERCLESKMRAEEIQADLKRVNTRAFAKRFACEPRNVESDG